MNPGGRSWMPPISLIAVVVALVPVIVKRRKTAHKS
jgi:hypothetical protein